MRATLSIVKRSVALPAAIAVLLLQGCYWVCADSWPPGIVSEDCCEPIHNVLSGAPGQVWWVSRQAWLEDEVPSTVDLQPWTAFGPSNDPDAATTAAVVAVTPTMIGVRIPDVAPGDYSPSGGPPLSVGDAREAYDLTDEELTVTLGLDTWYNATACYTVPGPPPPPPREYPLVTADIGLPPETFDGFALNIWARQSEEELQEVTLNSERFVDMLPLDGGYPGPQFTTDGRAAFLSRASGAFLRVELIVLSNGHRGPPSFIKVP